MSVRQIVNNNSSNHSTVLHVGHKESACELLGLGSVGKARVLCKQGALVLDGLQRMLKVFR